MIREFVVPKLNIVDGGSVRLCELDTGLARVEAEGVRVGISRGTTGPAPRYAATAVVDDQVMFAC